MTKTLTKILIVVNVVVLAFCILMLLRTPPEMVAWWCIAAGLNVLAVVINGITVWRGSMGEVEAAGAARKQDPDSRGLGS